MSGVYVINAVTIFMNGLLIKNLIMAASGGRIISGVNMGRDKVNE